MVVSGDELYRAVIAGKSQTVTSLLTDLKTHVKKDNVALPLVPKYFEALSIVMDTTDPAVQALAFSSICHLVKRVSIQDSTGKVLADQSFLVLPIVIPRIADKKSSISASARRALEAYWLSVPVKVEQALIDVGLSNRSLLIINETVVWLNHILTEINPYFKLDAFFTPLAQTLNKHASNTTLVENIKVLFANYYDLKQNKLHQFELQKVLESSGVSTVLRASIMGTDAVLSHQPQKPSRSHELDYTSPSVHSQPTYKSSKYGSRPSTSFKGESNEPSLNISVSTINSSTGDNSTSGSNSHSDSTNGNGPANDSTSLSELEKLTEGLANYKLDMDFPSKNVSSESSIHDLLVTMFPCFEHKETEKNWISREKSIQQLRQIIRGNAQSEYRLQMLQAIKELSEGIQKALLSLRTTLNVHSCQLVKEMAIFFGAEFDALAEIFLPTLIKLCSATKHMTNTNANVAVSSILANCTLHSRIIQRISTAATDKSTTTKSYAAFWLQIYLVRCHSQSLCSEIVGKLLPKLLADPNSQVRQSAKDAYWQYRKLLPESADELLGKLDSNVIRALERSKPADEKFTSLMTTKKSRPSLKEAIMARNKQMRAKTSETRSTSSFLPRRPNEFEEFNQRSVNRIASDPLRGPSRTERGHAPHYAQSTFSHRATTQPLLEVIKSSSAPPSEIKSAPSLSPPSLHFSTHSASTLAKQSPEVLNDQAAAFEGRNDPILKFLLSSQEEFIREGVNLLRYALIGDEDISKEIKLNLRKVSISNTEMLRPLFEEGESLFKKACRLFQIDDFFRIIAILLPVSTKNLDLILSLFEVEQIYDSINTLLSYVADLDNIVDEKLLVMQIIKYKSKILDMLVQFLNKVILKMPISDVKFAKLTANLVELVPIVDSSWIFADYQLLLQTLHSINKSLFVAQLSLASNSLRAEVEQIVGIDHSLLYSGDVTIFNMTDLTRISPGRPPVGLSPLRQPSDFTMLLPPKSHDSNFTDVTKAGQVPKIPEIKQGDEEDNEMDLAEDATDSENPAIDVAMREASEDRGSSSSGLEEFPLAENDPVSIGEETPPEVTPEENIFSTHDSEIKRTDFFAKLNSPDLSHELADDFAQVQLSGKSNSIQLFIDKVDPLNKISRRNRQISIFEDSKAGSPQKIREYSYTDFNWFNFLVAKLSLDHHAEDFDSNTVDEFKGLCKKLGECKLSGTEFIGILRFLQNEQAPDFNHFFSSLGQSLVEQSLWQFFLSSKAHDKLSGLIISKQLLINRVGINLNHLWHTLLELSGEFGSPSHELDVAISETFDEALCGVYSSAELFHIVSKTLKEPQLIDTRALRFAVESLFKLMSARTLALIINEDLFCRADDVLRGLLDHKDTLVRKYVLQTYGKLVRAARVSDASGGNKSTSMDKSGMKYIDDLMGRVTGPQMKLIEFFSQ